MSQVREGSHQAPIECVSDNEISLPVDALQPVDSPLQSSSSPQCAQMLQQYEQPVIHSGSSEDRKRIHLHSSRTVQNKLDWASLQLAHTHSVDDSIKLCILIKACAEALVALQRL